MNVTRGRQDKKPDFDLIFDYNLHILLPTHFGWFFRVPIHFLADVLKVFTERRHVSFHKKGNLTVLNLRINDGFVVVVVKVNAYFFPKDVNNQDQCFISKFRCYKNFGPVRKMCVSEGKNHVFR